MFDCHSVQQAVRRALLAGAAIAAVPAMSARAADDPISEVIVTGTRIVRPNLTAPTAVITIDAAAIQQSGLGNAADILRGVPSFGASTISTTNSNFQTANAGLNTLELRNLTEDRTLVLVNGRRYVSGLPGTSAVDFNTIPVALIERVEVITGGASAIYGSDALAGVINVILKRDYEGVDLNYQFGEATAGGDVQNRASLTAGGGFADGRGNAVVSATFSQQQGLLARERGNTRVDDIALCTRTGQPQDCRTPVENVFSSFSEFGRFIIPSNGRQFTVADGSGPTGTVVPYDNAAFGFNRQQFRRYAVPTDRYLISSLLDYEMSPDTKAFFEAMFAQTSTSTDIEPFPHSSDDLNIGGISIDNPFMPQAIRDAAIAAGDTEVAYARRTTEIGERAADATRNTYRFVTGLEGDIQDSWNWQAYYSFGRMDDSQQSGGQINVANMRNALDAVDGDGNPNTFDPVCASAAARLEGCAPINLFGKGSISPEAAAYVAAPASRQSYTQQEVFGATFNGPTFELPAGPLNLVVGAEWRRERAEDVPDVLTQGGLNAGNAQAPIRGSYDVGELFAEIDVPLLRDLPLVRELSVGGAFRYSDYSTVGNTSAYTGRISWSPVESLRLRGQVARAVRAPNIGELFAPGGENFAPVADPCNGVTATTPGVIAQRCRSIPAIAQRIATTGSFTLSVPEQQGVGGFTAAGNANLDVETSDSFTFGMIFDRNFGAAGAVMLSLDYFDVEIEDVIATVSRQGAIDFCFDGASFPNEFCQFLTRDSEGPAFELGELTAVDSRFINEGTLQTQGVDLAVQWTWPRLPVAIPGQLALRLNYTHLLDYTQVQFGEEDDRVGETAFSEDESQTALVYSAGPWTVQWEWTFLSDAIPDNSSPLFSFDVGSYSVHDLQIAFDFGRSNLLQGMPFRSTRLYVGANNLLDEAAPLILSGVPGNSTGTDTDATVYNPIGRTWYAGLNVAF